MSDQTDQPNVVIIEPPHDFFDNLCSNLLMSKPGENDHVVNIGVIDTIANCPTHPHNLVSVSDGQKAVTSRNDAADHLEISIIQLIPPVCFPVFFMRDSQGEIPTYRL